MTLETKLKRLKKAWLFRPIVRRGEERIDDCELSLGGGIMYRLVTHRLGVYR
jgi:hypothetical protein